MIFGSFGLLVVAVILLIAAIIKSSVALGIGSLICTIASAVLLMAANAYYKKLTLDAQYGAEGESGDSQLRRMATTGGAAQGSNGGATVVHGNGHVITGGAGSMAGVPVVVAARAGALPQGFELLNATQAASLVDTLNLDELHEVRRFEVENQGRKTVLAAVDRRIQAIVNVRKQVATTES